MHQRKELEHLCRYITRPAIANERLKQDGAGNVVLQLMSHWRDGTTHIRTSPLAFMQRLAGLRAVIVPGPAHKPREHAKEHAHASARMGWARLLRRVFDLGYISPMQFEKNWLAEQLKSAA